MRHPSLSPVVFVNVKKSSCLLILDFKECTFPCYFLEGFYLYLIKKRRNDSIINIINNKINGIVGGKLYGPPYLAELVFGPRLGYRPGSG